MRLSGERLQMLASQFGVGNGQELLLDLRLGGEVRVAEDQQAERRIGRRAAGISKRMKSAPEKGVRQAAYATS